jgi:hypothetical protein
VDCQLDSVIRQHEAKPGIMYATFVDVFEREVHLI